MVSINTNHVTQFNNRYAAPKTQKGNFSLPSVSTQNSASFELRLDALYSGGMRLPGGGIISVSVYKSEHYSEDYPIMLVKGKDVDGTYFEVEININDINPRNASMVELCALDGYYRAKGQDLDISGAASRALGAQEALGKNVPFPKSAFEKYDFISTLQELMEMQLANKHIEGYLYHKNVIDTLLNITAKK